MFNQIRSHRRRQTSILFALFLIVTTLPIVACQSPDGYEIDATANDSTATMTISAGAIVTATSPMMATPTLTLPPSPVPTSTGTAPAASTATEAPETATQEPDPNPTFEPTSTPTAAESLDANDVWNIRQFDIDDPIMVLTFDAGADAGFTGEILDVLAAEGIRASFGMTGLWAEDNPELLARIINEGHHLINHSWSHPHFPELNSDERQEELDRLEQLVIDELGIELQPYFRPPFGEYDDPTLADLAANGYLINVLWTVDTLGWNGLSAAEINARVMDAAAPGAIVLMHVGSQSQDAAALPEMIRLLRDRGFSFATVEDLVNR